MPLIPCGAVNALFMYSLPSADNSIFCSQQSFPVLAVFVLSFCKEGCYVIVKYLPCSLNKLEIQKNNRGMIAPCSLGRVCPESVVRSRQMEVRPCRDCREGPKSQLFLPLEDFLRHLSLLTQTRHPALATPALTSGGFFSTKNQVVVLVNSCGNSASLILLFKLNISIRGRNSVTITPVCFAKPIHRFRFPQSKQGLVSTVNTAGGNCLCNTCLEGINSTGFRQER